MDDSQINEFLQDLKEYKKFVNAYTAIRKELKRLGHTEETVSRVTNVTSELMENWELFKDSKEKILKVVPKMLGIDEESVKLRLQTHLSILNNLYPLNDGDNERRD